MLSRCCGARHPARDAEFGRTGWFRLALLATVALAAIAPPAAAQEVSATPEQDVTADRNLDKIVVTAQRREETAATIGMGIQAFTGDRLEQLHLTDMNDLSMVAPSFTVSQSYQGVPIYTLRGIGFNTINLSATSTVGTYVDEVAYPYPFMLTGPIFDVERVEVLKGPQGTLYGRNTTAGLIDFITRKPTDDFEASVTAEGGNYGSANFGGYVSGPVGNTLKARFAFRTEDSFEGWQKSNTRDESLGETHRYAGRLKLDWQPAERLNFDLTVSGWLNKSDTIAGQGIGFTPNTDPLTGPFGPFNAPGLPAYIAANLPTSATQADWAPESVRSADIGIGAGLSGPLQEDNSFYAVALRTTYEFSDSTRMVALTGYNHLKRDALFDWSGAPYEVLLQEADGEISSVSQEVRLEGETDWVKWLVGGYYGNDDLTDNNRTLLGENANVAAIRYTGLLLLGSPFNTGGYTPLDMLQAFRTYRDLGDLGSSTWSVFGNADWTLTDQLSLTTGIRYTQDKQTYTGCSADFNGSMLPNVNVVNRYLVTLLFAAPTPAEISANDCVTYDPGNNAFMQISHELKEDNVAWRTALEWTPADNILLYASVSDGAKAGNTPINAANISTQELPARQEKLLAYEAGVKAGLLGDTMQANLAYFYYDYTDKQLSVYFADPIYTALARLQNVPDAYAQGVDADITWRVTRNLTLTGSALWLDTAVVNYNGINAAGLPELYDGRPFLYSPEWQASGTLLYARPITSRLGLSVALNGRWQSESAADLGDDPRFVIDSYGVMNAGVGIQDLEGGWEFSVWGRNVTDTYYWTSVASNANVVVRFPGRPATYGASLTFNF